MGGVWEDADGEVASSSERFGTRRHSTRGDKALSRPQSEHAQVMRAPSPTPPVGAKDAEDIRPPTKAQAITLPPMSALLASLPPDPSAGARRTSEHVLPKSDWAPDRRHSQPAFVFGSAPSSYRPTFEVAYGYNGRPQFPSSQDRRSPQIQFQHPPPLPSGMVVDAPPLLAPNPPPPASRDTPIPRAHSRPRSNSLTMDHPPYAGPPGNVSMWHRENERPHTADWPRPFGASREDYGDASRGSKWEFVAAGGDLSSPPYLARKRRLEPLYRPEYSYPHREPPIFRPRAASISTTDEYRTIPAWVGAGNVRHPSRFELDEANLHHRSPFGHRGSSDSLRSLGSSSESSTAWAPMQRAESRTPDMSGLRITAPSPRRGSLVATSAMPTTTAFPEGSIPVMLPHSRYPLPTASTAWTVMGGRNSYDENMDLAGADSNARYACPHCPKRFARPSSLRIHIHSHTGEKPFSCKMCGRGFSVQSNLRRHLKIHASTGNGLKSATSFSRDARGSSTDEGEADEDLDQRSLSGGSGSEEGIKSRRLN